VAKSPPVARRRLTITLERVGVAISVASRGRVNDSVFIGRLWRSSKYQDIHLKGYADGWSAFRKVGAGFRNNAR
jgi:hypothetical protein